MTGAQQIKEVAGCLHAAGHDLARAVAAAQAVSAEDGHEVAQLECAVKLMAKAWRNRNPAYRRLDARVPGHD